jgi:transcription initiation factor TFIIIB Brf1 subunit/transcription initiation factor TFIIB
MRTKWLEMQGKTVNGFKILEVYRENKRTMAKVVCPACGKISFVNSGSLTSGRIKSCGCLRKPHEIKQGKRMAAETKKQCIDGTSIRSLTMKKPKTNTSGIKGVSWDKSRNKWVAQIQFKGKNYYLGRYANKEDAREAREKAEKEMFGKFLEEHKEYVKEC